MNLSVRAIRYFVATCELGSLSRAAEVMRISNSAIAAALDSVEEEFGVQLVLRRRSRGIVLTPSGRGILTHAKHFLEEYDRFLAAGSDLNSVLKGSLRIGYFAPVSPAFLPSIIRPLLEQGDNVYIEMVDCNNDEAQEGLRTGKFDAAVFLDYALQSGICHDVLLEIPPFLITPKTHPLARKAAAKFSDLEGEDFVLLNLPATLEYYTTMLNQVGLKPNVVIGASSVEMVRSSVAAGLGCSILNMRPATAQTYFGEEIACVPLSDRQERALNLVVGYAPGQLRNLTQAFIANCNKYFSSDMNFRHTVPYNSSRK